MARQPIDSALREAIERFNQQYAAGDPAWVDAFTEDALIYPIDAAEPIRGAAEYRRHLGDHLRRQREARVLSVETQVTGETAIVAQILQITLEGISTVIRETSVWRLDGGRWRVHHLDASVLASGFAAGTAPTAGAVRVLKEKIAAMAAQAGVAQ